MNFIMDMGYSHDNTERFNFWAATLGNSRVMNGMSHQYNDLKSTIAWASWHPTPEKAGVMVFAGNVNKQYTDTIFAALGGLSSRLSHTQSNNVNQHSSVYLSNNVITCEFLLRSADVISLRAYSLNGKLCATIFENRYEAGTQCVRKPISGIHLSAGVYNMVLGINGLRQGYRMVRDRE
jgi:hypothetical protein